MGKKSIAATISIITALGIGLFATAPAQAGPGCIRQDGTVWTYHYAYTQDYNGLCGTLGVKHWYNPTPGVSAATVWYYTTGAYVQTPRLAYMYKTGHSGS